MNGIAERFERLVEVYRKPDGSRWGGQDLEDATGGAVTRSYVSALRRGVIESPGYDKLKAIAGAMGFRPELWFEDTVGTLPYPSVTNDGPSSFSERLEHLFETVVAEKSNRPCTNAEVARMSFGGLTEEEVARIRSGELGQPTLDQVLALSEAFGVDPSYFTRRSGRQDESLAALAQEEYAAIVHKTMALSQDDRRMVLDLLDHLGNRGKPKKV